MQQGSKKYETSLLLSIKLLHKAKLVPQKILGELWGTTIFQDLPRTEKQQYSKKPHGEWGVFFSVFCSKVPENA
jgi:hypothetical protein